MYCVYITFYSGTKLPPLYIGSSSVDRVLNKSYHGTVTSKLYKSIWEQELKNNPEVFETAIISTHLSKEDAIATELKEQIFFDVVKNPKFINRSFATVNGCFTMDKHGEKNPMFGKKHTIKSRKLISDKANNRGSNNPMFGKPPTRGMLNKKHRDDSKVKMSNTHQERGNNKGNKNPMFGKLGAEHPSFGYKHTEEFIKSQKTPKPIVTCPHCDVSGGKPAMTRFHFEKCKKFISS